MCKYQFENNQFCQEKAYRNSGFCILHLDFSEEDLKELLKFDFSSDHASKNLLTLDSGELLCYKEQKVLQMLRDKNYNFEGAKLFFLKLFNLKINKPFQLNNAVIYKGALFENIDFHESSTFANAVFKGRAEFKKAIFREITNFTNVIFESEVIFFDSELGIITDFSWVIFEKHIMFEEVKIKGYIYFNCSQIKYRLDLYVSGGKEIHFVKTKFYNLQNEEKNYMLAKKRFDDEGNYDLLDYHYFREMVAKRKQKNWLPRGLEYGFIQLPFAYGAKWSRVLFTWLFVVFGFAIWYSFGHGVFTVVNGNKVVTKSFLDCFYFSVVTATTLGYGDFTPRHGLFQVLVSFEAIFGTFMWAAFITIFARKYMR